MKEIGKRIWNEPAVAIGLLTTLILLVINFISNDHWTVDHIIAILAPLISALGIRQAVIPTSKLDEITKPPSPEGTTLAGQTGYGVKK